VERTVSTSLSTVAPGGSFRVKDLVANRGHATSRASTTRFFLNKVVIGFRPVPALRKGRTSAGSVSLVVPSATPDGIYAVRACADADNRVRESNERNNCNSAKLTVATPPPPPSLLDSDGDGYPDNVDCAPHDPSIHPGAADKPDLGFVDSNCDGIDGDKTKAIFVSPTGKDSNPGTMARPKQSLNAAVTAAALVKKDVYAAAGGYGRVDLASGVSIYGGYGAGWSRPAATATAIIGPGPEAALADGATGVTIQLLTLNGNPLTGPGASAYGLRAINGSNVVLEQDIVSAGDARAGADGAAGAAGAAGGNGSDGAAGDCDAAVAGNQNGGAGGTSPANHPGGSGGRGGQGPDAGFDPGTPYPGADGGRGVTDIPGGVGGIGGNPGHSGAKGSFGLEGANGANGVGGANVLGSGLLWAGLSGSAGTNGQPGNGGGGGGGGGGQYCAFCMGGTGNQGGGGGGGGGGGSPGAGGSAGGGSFGVYIWNSAVSIVGSTIRAGAGGAGGRGGDGGAGGLFGAPGKGGTACTNEVGAGGDGGFGALGGFGGAGGGGAGGPSIAVFRVSNAALLLDGATLVAGVPGAGGRGGTNPLGSGGDGQPGIALTYNP
jgi:CARDB protein